MEVVAKKSRQKKEEKRKTIQKQILMDHQLKNRMHQLIVSQTIVNLTPANLVINLHRVNLNLKNQISLVVDQHQAKPNLKLVALAEDRHRVDPDLVQDREEQPDHHHQDQQDQVAEVA